ncbi:class II fructose-bisphosphate aldolase [candidate division WS5 bacterium]|uniref:Class II fructose-bisphosphate aldolase n=1 Tax=candidate division WS5 bacterium TaxID=2093353 RepID=A0A419DG39_9BACT|nr:MAG: class II fructose-bisphosphate aldolase [candidate division WS5 bacterium]
MIVSAKELLGKARDGKYAIGAFNSSTLEITKGILQAAAETKMPVIIETSEGEANFEGYQVFADTVRDISEELGIDVAINLDHGKSLESVKYAIASGYSSVHLDGSSLEKKDNIDLTKKVVQYAHLHNVSVEGELGYIGGSSEVHKDELPKDEIKFTDPNEAVEYIKETGVDIFAGSYGNIHGMYKDEPKLYIGIIQKISQASGIPLSLHGGSGIPEDQIRAAIQAGICKININTEIRQAYREALDNTLKGKNAEIVPYKYLPEVINAVKEVVKKKIILFSGK